MKEHIKNLIERLTRYSEKLDNIALFADKKWVLIDNEGNQESYIFERGGDLVMSKNGKVKMGKWKVYPEAKSIKIDRVEDQILLNQAFFDKALMILKYDGIKNNSFFILADEDLIPDLNIEKYLSSKANINYIKDKNINIEIVELMDDRFLIIHSVKNQQINMEVIIGDSKPDNGNYYGKNNHIYIIEAGKIKDIRFLCKYKCTNGTIVLVDQKYRSTFNIGEKVITKDFKPAPSGKYKLSWFNYFIVEDGIITSESFFG